MRWVCKHYPQLPLEALAPPADKPCAVIEVRGSRKWLAVLNPLAAHRGLHAGMSLPAAKSLVPELLALARNPEAEAAALSAAACQAYRFGAPVTVGTKELAVWVEVSRSISLFGGWRKLAEALQQPDAHLPWQQQMAAAPTQSCAYLLARASLRPRRPVATLAGIPAALAELPIAALPFDEASLQLLHGAGLRRIAEVLAIPAEALGQRIGAHNLAALQKLLGQQPEAWEAWLPPTTYRRRFDFAEPVETTEALLFPLKMMLGEFVAYLRVRDLSIQHFSLRLVDSRRRVVRHKVGLLSPTRELPRLLTVLREQLDRLQLEDAVIELSLVASRFEPAAARQNDLFEEAGVQVGERLTELKERLAARLGSSALRQLVVSPDQRPEQSSKSTTIGEKAALTVRGKQHPERPLWLLAQPQRILPRRLLGPAERIELGWWDAAPGQAPQRDYVLAEDSDGRLCWVFREAGSGQWQLHGLWQ